MDDRDTSPQSRRELLRSAARWTLGGGLVLLTAGLAARRHGASSKQQCDLRIPCTRCKALARCSLPPAVSLKNNNRGGS